MTQMHTTPELQLWQSHIYLTHPFTWLRLQVCINFGHSRCLICYLYPYFVCMVVFLHQSGILYMVSEQYTFPGWGFQPHAHPQLSWKTDDFLSGLSPLADQARF